MLGLRFAVLGLIDDEGSGVAAHSQYLRQAHRVGSNLGTFGETRGSPTGAVDSPDYCGRQCARESIHRFGCNQRTLALKQTQAHM